MRKLAPVALSLTLALLGAAACSDDGTPPPAGEQTPTATQGPDGTPAGGEAGEVTVEVGQAVILSDPSLGDEVEITILSISEPTQSVWFDIEVEVRIAVTSGSYIASPYSFTLIGADGSDNPPMRNSFSGLGTLMEEGESVERDLTFSVEDEGILDGATIAVYGIGDEVEALVAHYPVG